MNAVANKGAESTPDFVSTISFIAICVLRFLLDAAFLLFPFCVPIILFNCISTFKCACSASKFLYHFFSNSFVSPNRNFSEDSDITLYFIVFISCITDDCATLRFAASFIARPRPVLCRPGALASDSCHDLSCDTFSGSLIPAQASLVDFETHPFIHDLTEVFIFTSLFFQRQPTTRKISHSRPSQILKIIKFKKFNVIS